MSATKQAGAPLFFHVLSCFLLYSNFQFCNSHAALNLDGCDRLFSLHLFRTLPVGYIPGRLLVCAPSLLFLLFYSTARAYPFVFSLIFSICMRSLILHSQRKSVQLRVISQEEADFVKGCEISADFLRILQSSISTFPSSSPNIECQFHQTSNSSISFVSKRGVCIT